MWGRRKALLFGGVMSVVGGGLQAGSVHIAMYLVARLVTGFGIGKHPSNIVFGSPD